MVPMILAFTISIKPSLRATKAMINLVALPNTALSKPPIEGPVTTAIFSVAVLNQMAKGAIASADVMKTVSDPHSKRSAAMEIGMNTSKPRETMVLIDLLFLIEGRVLYQFVIRNNAPTDACSA